MGGCRGAVVRLFTGPQLGADARGRAALPTHAVIIIVAARRRDRDAPTVHAGLTGIDAVLRHGAVGVVTAAGITDPVAYAVVVHSAVRPLHAEPFGHVAP